ncbi:MAG: hypothetical protein KGS72_08530 [Cyanobacteria bacterium REEB67]|nr:hypothetical protein [Cyanobacteria bacterium REEB67]
MPIRLICSLIALTFAFGQLFAFAFAGPALAQGYPLPGYYPDYRQFPSYRGVSAGGVGYSPFTTGPQYGYSAWGNRRYPGNGAGTAIGLGLYGGMVGIGALAVGSRILANRKYNQKHNNPQANQKLASKERRANQELKIRGELDQDYQKELSEKGMLPPTAQLPSGAGFNGPGAGFSSASAAPAAAPSMNMAAPSFKPTANPPQEQLSAPVYNPTPWTPDGAAGASQPSF